MSLADVLAAVMAVEVEEDGALTVRHDGKVAAVRVVPIVAGLEVVSLTQALAWDVPDTAELRERVAAQAGRTMFGTVTLAEQSGELVDVMLRYNFPGNGLDAHAMQTLVLMVLDAGAQIRRELV